MQHDARVQLDFQHRLIFDERVFTSADSPLAQLMERYNGSARAQVYIDSGVRDHHPEIASQIESWADAHGITLASDIVVVPGGERCKNDPAAIERVLEVMHDAKLCRRSYAIVIGGGAVLDAVGYAAALIHRGIRLIRVPSTTLAQCDSGVGVKNGVNAFGKKNYLGTFAVPWAVVNDESLLGSLDDADWIGGFSEVVKVALLKDAALFEQVECDAARIAQRDLPRSIPLIRRSAELHLKHICDGGDPFEMNEARPLDFGHWAAHKLEQMTGFTIAHGHAVAVGLALDVSYASAIGLLPAEIRDRVLGTLETLGFTLGHALLMETQTLLGGLDEFREHLGGRLTITLIDGIGSQIDVHEIDGRIMKRCAHDLAKRSAPQPVR